MQNDEPNEEPDFYATLGVAPDASTEIVKRAYFRLVRVHRPDLQPEAFQRFHVAYETLSSGPRRRAYDQMRRYGDEIQKRMDEVNALMEIEPRRAIRVLKEVLVLSPDASEPRLLLSKANLQCGEYQSAELELKRLAARFPQDAALHYELAYCLWMQDRPTEAEHEIQRTLALDPLFHDALMLLAHLHQARRESGRAVAALERAIALDRRENHNDLAALLRLLTIFVVEEDEPNTERTAGRIQTVLVSTEDEQRIEEGTGRIVDLAQDFFQNRNFSGAHRIAVVAGQVVGGRDGRMPNRVQRALDTTVRASDAARVAQDRRITGALQTYLCGKYLSATNGNFGEITEEAETVVAENEKREKAVAQLHARVLEEARRNAGPYRLMVAHLRATYPTMADAEAQILAAITDLVGSAARNGNGEKDSAEVLCADKTTLIYRAGSKPDQATLQSAEDAVAPQATVALPPHGSMPRATLISVARNWAARWRSSE